MMSPPREGDGAWARGLEERGDRRRPRCNFTSAFRCRVQIDALNLPAARPRFVFAASVVAIHSPAQTATNPITSCSVSGSCRIKRRQQSGDNRVDRHGVGDAAWARVLQRIDPEEKRQRAAAGAEIGRGEPLRRRELCNPSRRRRCSALTTTSAAAPTAMLAVTKPSALDRWMNGRVQTL